MLVLIELKRGEVEKKLNQLLQWWVTQSVCVFFTVNRIQDWTESV